MEVTVKCVPSDEEYDALDEYYTHNLPPVSGNGKSGFFAQHTEKGRTVIFVGNALVPDTL